MMNPVRSLIITVRLIISVRSPITARRSIMRFTSRTELGCPERVIKSLVS